MIPPHEPAGYRQIADDLRGQIDAGVLSPGQRMMSIADLAHTYGVAIGTAERAMHVLKAEGLIMTDRGKRSRVAGRPDTTAQPVPRGGSNGPARPGTPEECRALGLPEGSMVTPLKDAGGRVVALFPALSTEFTSK